MRGCPNNPRHIDWNPRLQRCWTCDHAERVAKCDHKTHEPMPRWAGILGYRYDCGACGTQISELSNADSREAAAWWRRD